MQLKVGWVKPELEDDPMHWVLRVEGLVTDDEESDLSLMWYVASADGYEATFDSISNSITGLHESAEKNFWLSYIDSDLNQNA